MSKVLLLDIDGVVCKPQKPMTDSMRGAINHVGLPVYFVTGNTFTKSIDLLQWHGFHGIFCNNGDELRDRFGFKIWEDTKSEPLPVLSLLDGKNNNSIEWRSPRFVNVCPIGRYASHEERALHDASWRDGFIADIKGRYDVEAVKGGQVSVDIYSKGADKARAAKWLNDYGYEFYFIGDKTEPGGNDWPIRNYCESVNNKNLWFTSESISHTITLLDQIRKVVCQNT